MSKIMKLRLLQTLILLTVSACAYSQTWHITESPVSRIVPQSQAVSGLTRYGTYPMDLCYGLVDISVPVYTIRTSQFEVPISLSYHSSGIKVDEVASIVGLGWSLNACGQISVDVKGGNDSEESFLTENEIDSILSYGGKDSAIEVYNAFEDVLSGIDSQADMYFYNAGSISGRFTYNDSGKLFQISYTDNRIQDNIVIDSQPRFLITSADGTRYFFGGKYVDTSAPDGKSLKTAYLLNKIVSADGNDSIVFNYHLLDNKMTMHAL